MASSEAEDAAVPTTNGISLAPVNLEEEVAHLMSQEVPCAVFDTDTEVAMDSMLNAKLEFDEAFLSENVALHCGVHSRDVEGIVQDVEMQKDNQGNGSENEDSSHYFKFSRSVVHGAAGASDPSGNLPSSQSISQLDGADGGSESDEDEVVEEETNIGTHYTPTKQLTVALKRLESVFSVSRSNPEQQATQPAECQKPLSPPAVLESSYTENELSLQEEEVPMTSDTQVSQKDAVLDSATGHFVMSEGGSMVPINQSADVDKDDGSSSADSVEGFKDDLSDPDYSPDSKTKKQPLAQMKTIIVKAKQPPKGLLPKSCLQYKPKLSLPLTIRPGQAVDDGSLSSATVHAVPRPVTSPIIINGLNAFPVQPGATQGRTLAIRLDHSKTEGQQQQVATQNQTEAVSSPAPQVPSRQVLLVNRQGQILIKDPKSNTFQVLGTNSPTYNRISSIAKILHKDNTLNHSVPRVLIKARPSLPTTNVPPASNHTTSERKVVFRVVPVNTNTASVSHAPINVLTVPHVSFSNIGESTAQAIIDRAMATHRNTRPNPIILSSAHQPKARHQMPSQVLDVDNSLVGHSESPSGFSNEEASVSSHHQVRVKRVSSLSERPSRKKSKIDYLKDPSSEQEEVQEARYLKKREKRKCL